MSEKIKILFVGELHSSHALSWIRLLDSYKDQFHIEGVSLGGLPDNVGYYVRSGFPKSSSRIFQFVRMQLLRMYIPYKKWADPIRSLYEYGPPEIQFKGLITSLLKFNPHIVHTFGFTPGALIYASIPEVLRKKRRWVLQCRGGSDVAFTQAIPEWQTLFRRILPMADVVLADNLENFKIFDNLGIDYKKTPLLPTVPGAGGLKVSDFEPVVPWTKRENLIVWPKAYESPWSKSLPVLEGLKLALDIVPSVKCVFTAVCKETMNHIRLLPKHIKNRITILDRIPHSEMMQLMQTSRVMLAPSLVDGFPNSLLEAMTAGAIPIVSPLPTITPFVTEGKNVIFARNLYPEEISAAIVRAFTLSNAEDMVNTNIKLVKQIADRNTISQKVKEMYFELAV